MGVDQLVRVQSSAAVDVPDAGHVCCLQQLPDMHRVAKLQHCRGTNLYDIGCKEDNDELPPWKIQQSVKRISKVG
jgi:hypothetical protein